MKGNFQKLQNFSCFLTFFLAVYRILTISNLLLVASTAVEKVFTRSECLSERQHAC